MDATQWCDFIELEAVVTTQFHSEEYSVHGPSHWRRVEQNGIWISRRSGADEFVTRLFAWFHDSRRINDYTDPGHGERGAEFAVELRGKLFEMSDEQFAILHYACSWHTDEDHTEDPTIGTCWDSDRMDLGRVGVTPSSEFMNTAFGKAAAKAGSFYTLLDEQEIAEQSG